MLQKQEWLRGKNVHSDMGKRAGDRKMRDTDSREIETMGPWLERRKRKRKRKTDRKREKLCIQPIYDGWNAPREKCHGLQMVSKEREPYSTRVSHRYGQSKCREPSALFKFQMGPKDHLVHRLLTQKLSKAKDRVKYNSEGLAQEVRRYRCDMTFSILKYFPPPKYLSAALQRIQHSFSCCLTYFLP